MAKFAKGQSGNPGGRRKRSQAEVDLLAEIKRQLAQAGPEGKLSRGAELVQAMIAAAVAGDVNAQRELLNRTVGRVPVAVPPEKIDLERVAAVMQERRRQLDTEQPVTASSGQTAGNQQAPVLPPKCGFVEIAEPEPPAAPGPEPPAAPELPGTWYDHGGINLRID